MYNNLTNLTHQDNNRKHRTSRSHKNPDPVTEDHPPVLEIPFQYKGQTEVIQVERFIPNKTNLLNKSLILFGGSGSGKTFMVKYLLKCASGAFGLSMLFNPTFHDNGDFKGIFPEQLVHTDGSKVTLQTFKDLTQWQEEVTRISQTVEANLLKMFRKYATPDELNLYRKARDTYERKAKSVSGPELEDLTYAYGVSTNYFFKHCIAKNKHIRVSELNSDERYTLQYLGLNPHRLFIFDDFYTEIVALLKEATRTKQLELPNFFFRGRHKKVTPWMLFQGYKIDTEVRKNAHTLLFTSKALAIGFYGLPENTGSTHERKKMEAIIEYVFSENKCGNKYYKLYIDRTINKMYYIVAEPTQPEDIRLFSPQIMDFMEKIKLRESARPKTKYTDLFRGYT